MSYSPRQVALALKDAHDDKDCHVCGNSLDDCMRYYEWCLGRTARFSFTNTAGWWDSFVQQIALVMQIEDDLDHGDLR